jgi:hypothetical protein
MSRSTRKSKSEPENSRVNVDKVINEIRTLRNRLSEMTPIATPGSKRKTVQLPNEDSDEVDPDPFNVLHCTSLPRNSFLLAQKFTKRA